MGDEDRCSGLQMSCFRGAGSKVLLLGGLIGRPRQMGAVLRGQNPVGSGCAQLQTDGMGGSSIYRWHACEVTGRQKAVRSEARALAV